MHGMAKTQRAGIDLMLYEYIHLVIILNNAIKWNVLAAESSLPSDSKYHYYEHACRQVAKYRKYETKPNGYS
jgi:hypothetical protein